MARFQTNRLENTSESSVTATRIIMQLLSVESHACKHTTRYYCTALCIIMH